MKTSLSQQLILGLALFLTFMFIMERFFKPEPKPAAKPAAPVAAAPAGPSAPAAAAPGVQAQTPSAAAAAGSAPVVPYENITIQGAQFTAVFTTRGAALKQYTLNRYFNLPDTKKNGALRAPLPLLGAMEPGRDSLALIEMTVGAERHVLTGRQWRLAAVPEGATGVSGVPAKGTELVFETVVSGLTVQRIYDFAQDKHFGFQHRLAVANPTANPVNLAYRLCGPAGIIPDGTDTYFGNLIGASGYIEKDYSVKHESYLTDLGEKGFFDHREKDIAWVGLNTRFFTALLTSGQPQLSAAAEYRVLRPAPDFAARFGNAAPWVAEVMRAHPQQASAELVTLPVTVLPGLRAEHKYGFYAGPLDDKIAATFDPHLKNLVTYTWEWLGTLSRPLLDILQYIADLTHNYGLAIILLTLFVKTVLHPLTRKSMRSQHKMQQIQPLMKKIREQYKDDRQKQQQETMRLFQEHGVNPIGGCLPMLLQMPIFFALYGVFSRCFVIRQEPFIPGWINDLSLPDSLFGLGFTVPFLGWTTFNLLPLLYILLQVWNMRLMPKSDDPQMETQMKMMRVMPVIFGFIFYAMPSGLVLYFVTQSILTIVEHIFIKRSLNKPAVAGAAAAAGADNATPVSAKVVESAPAGNAGGKKKKKR